MHPGTTDTPDEWEALKNVLSTARANLIQMRNLNIDPDWVYQKVFYDIESTPGFGILQWMIQMKSTFPDIAFGYYNPYLGKKEKKS